MGILITKRKQMRKLFIRTLALALCLTGTAQALRAQETTAAQTAATADQRPKTINEMRQERGLTDTHNLFVPKGQWIFGGTASYSTHTNKGYQFLVIEGINSKGYTFRVSPMIAYAFRDNMALGGRFIYSRTLLKLDNAELHFGNEETGTNIVARDFYSLKQTYSAAAIWRQYIPLGRNKRFALFNEMSLAAGGTQARFANDSPVKGTYETGYTLSLGISPGIVAFATNNMAVEVTGSIPGICFESDPGMVFSALPYTPHELENARHLYELPRDDCKTIVRCAAFQRGVGGDSSWGAKPHENVCFAAEKGMQFKFTLNKLN